MVDYEKMYALLCRAASAALDKLPRSPENKEGRALLQKALYEAEEMYIAAGPDDPTGK